MLQFWPKLVVWSIFGRRTRWNHQKLCLGSRKWIFFQFRLNKGKILVATCLPPVSGIRSVWVPINFYHGGLSLVQRGSPGVITILRYQGGPPLSLPSMSQRWPYEGLSELYIRWQICVKREIGFHYLGFIDIAQKTCKFLKILITEKTWATCKVHILGPMSCLTRREEDLTNFKIP